MQQSRQQSDVHRPSRQPAGIGDWGELGAELVGLGFEATHGAELAGVIARQAPAGVDVDRLRAAWVLERERVGEAQIFGRQRPSHQPSKAIGFGVQS
jgi:hypothetical protein